jgi:hypothetical protein
MYPRALGGHHTKPTPRHKSREKGSARRKGTLPRFQEPLQLVFDAGRADKFEAVSRCMIHKKGRTLKDLTGGRKGKQKTEGTEQKVERLTTIIDMTNTTYTKKLPSSVNLGESRSRPLP